MLPFFWYKANTVQLKKFDLLLKKGGFVTREIPYTFLQLFFLYKKRVFAYERDLFLMKSESF